MSLCISYGTTLTMNTGMIIKQREIVLMPFPYTDMSKSKKRPVLVLSNLDYNSRSEDVICCALTSNPYVHIDTVDLDNSELEEGKLRKKSKIKSSKIFTLSQKKIIKTIGRLKKEKLHEVLKRIDGFMMED